MGFFRREPKPEMMRVVTREVREKIPERFMRVQFTQGRLCLFNKYVDLHIPVRSELVKGLHLKDGDLVRVRINISKPKK
ncbi:MAG: hypothetical protein WC475_01650 [Candidatus Paceibacterota bacterium]